MLKKFNSESKIYKCVCVINEEEEKWVKRYYEV